jgi:hypothetical protein
VSRRPTNQDPPTLVGVDSVYWPDPKRGPYRVRCEWANIGGYSRLISVEVKGYLFGDDGPAVTTSGVEPVTSVTATAVRDLPLEHVAHLVWEKIAKSQAAFYVGPGEDVAIGHHVPGGKTGRKPLTTDDLAKVAAIYRAGGAKPTKAVADALGISVSAAAKRVARAREVGLLEPTVQGRAGGPTTTRPIKKRKQR